MHRRTVTSMKQGAFFHITIKLGFFSFLALMFCLSCSAASRNSGVGIGGTGGLGSAAQGGGTTGAGNTANTATQSQPCEKRNVYQPCYCTDGTTSAGKQFCDADGNLGPCEGCPDEVSTGGVIDTGLCAELQSYSECTAQRIATEEATASILFLVDRSASMACNPPPVQKSQDCEAKSEIADSTKPSKWKITITALKDVFARINGSNARGGLMFFSLDGICGANSDLALGGVPIQLINDQQVRNMSTALDIQEPGGSTPIVGATVLAYKQLYQVAGGDCAKPPCGATGNRFVVLFTDGKDQCPDPAFSGAPCGAKGTSKEKCTNYLLNTEVTKALKANIRTYVIGAPGSELAKGFLSELAYRGGTATSKPNCIHGNPDSTTEGDCHFDMSASTDFAGDLANVLRSISGSAIGCKFPVPAVPGLEIKPDKVNVQYTDTSLINAIPTCIAYDGSRACDSGANGWQFAKNPDLTDNLTQVVLCGDACTKVSGVKKVQVDVLAGCQRIIIQ